MGKTLNIVPASTLDYRRLAEANLPRFMFDYIDGGANDERTLLANVEDYGRVLLKQRVLRDVSSIYTQSTLAGERVAMPLALAPVGMAGLFSRRGEALGARAATASGVPFTLSTVGICSLSEVREAAGKPFWFQLYMVRDRVAVQRLLEAALEQGVTTLVFTVDLPVAGMRHRDTRNGMLENSLRGKLGKAWQLGTRPGWLWNVGVKGKPHTFANIADMVSDSTDLGAYREWLDTQFDTSVTWKDIEWLRTIWPGYLIIKGIQEVQDARCAADVGANGLVVSNHGGRQLDSVASSISKLRPIVEAVGDRMEILVDGGVRSGLDVFKALALGANGVLIGRPWVWAAAGGGEAGLCALLNTFKRELEVAMILTGTNRISDISPELIDKIGWN
jgi:L-lactate dehydrogenase (cytochrome)